jgi:hypothetical protein
MRRMMIAVALACVASLSACTDPEVASRKSLEAMGFSNVAVEWTFGAGFNCSENDGWARSFTATGVNGQPVSGTVCGGYVGKGATVRFD